MKVTVSEEAIARAAKCTRGYICRREDWTPCGRVTARLEGALIIQELHEKKGPFCAYHVQYGTDHCCTCPARIEIHKRFGV